MSPDPLAGAADIDLALESRAVSFENPTGAKGAGGATGGGRKGSPSRLVGPGESVDLADLEGPGQVRHIWMTVRPRPPESLRALWLEVFYDDLAGASIQVPVLDFFGLPHGRLAAYSSALTAVQEGRGLNAYFPMPFGRRIRVVFHNRSPDPVVLFYQIDLTLGDPDPRAYLHAAFRRQNPTVMREDFVICEGLRGPGRFLGCVVGVRPTQDGMTWWGEGEVKMYLDGDTDLPTISGTGVEDYVGAAWGLGPHAAPYQGAPLYVTSPEDPGGLPDYVGFYRWHLPDPIVFRRDLRVTIQQIGALIVPRGQEDQTARLTERHTLVRGWVSGAQMGSRGLHAFALAERVDDYCATAFVYCQAPQSVPAVDWASAVTDIGRKRYEPQ